MAAIALHCMRAPPVGARRRQLRPAPLGAGVVGAGLPPQTHQTLMQLTPLDIEFGGGEMHLFACDVCSRV